jgi:hypothetical protein
MRTTAPRPPRLMPRMRTRCRRGRHRAPVRRAAAAPAQRPVHPARRARDLPRRLRRSARPAAVPDPQAELQHPRHPDGPGHPAIPGIRRADPQEQPGAGGRVPADGGDAHRDQVAHAAAQAPGRAGRGRRRPARGTGAAPAGVRADQAGGPAAGRPAPGGTATSSALRCRSSRAWRRSGRTSIRTTCSAPGWTCCAARS